MNRDSRTASAVIAVVMLIAIVGGSVFQLFNRNLNNAASTPQATQTTVATFPPPVANPDTISYATLYMHPSGLFSVPIPNPPTWNSTEPTSNVTRQSVAFRNDLSVIEVYVEDAGTPITSMDQLNARYTTAILQGSWSRYSPVTETGRRIEGDRLLIDFELGFREQTFLARHVAWSDGTWVYVVRVVMPNNARDQLLATLNGIIANLQAYTQFRSTPMDWTSAFDPQARHLIRFPASWIITDSAPGLPTSISAPDGSVLRLESRTGSVGDETAARAFVETTHPGATIVSVAPVAPRDGASGFSVSYSLTNADGDSTSGSMVLLNGTDGTLHFADLRIPRAGVDLNILLATSVSEATAEATTEATAEATTEATAEATAPIAPTTVSLSDIQIYSQVMSTFWLFPNLIVPVPTPTPIPTALPTATVDPLLTPVVPTVEATAEATVEATTEATTEATVEVTTEATTEATVEATTEATAEATTAP